MKGVGLRVLRFSDREVFRINRVFLKEYGNICDS